METRGPLGGVIVGYYFARMEERKGTDRGDAVPDNRSGGRVTE